MNTLFEPITKRDKSLNWENELSSKEPLIDDDGKFNWIATGIPFSHHRPCNTFQQGSSEGSLAEDQYGNNGEIAGVGID